MAIITKNLPMQISTQTKVWEYHFSPVFFNMDEGAFITCIVENETSLEMMNSFLKRENETNKINKVIKSDPYSLLGHEINILTIFFNELLTTSEWTLKQFIDFLDNSYIGCGVSSIHGSFLSRWSPNGMPDSDIFRGNLWKEIKGIIKNYDKYTDPNKEIMSIIELYRRSEEKDITKRIGIIPHLIKSNFDAQGIQNSHQPKQSLKK